MNFELLLFVAGGFLAGQWLASQGTWLLFKPATKPEEAKPLARNATVAELAKAVAAALKEVPK